jgi:hypothetical protein
MTLNKRLERDDDSKKSHVALERIPIGMNRDAL